MNAVPSKGVSPRPRSTAKSEFINLFPLYQQVRNLLMRRLSEGFAIGDRFPTEHRLRDDYGVSRETIREALHGLEVDGFITRRRGSGTFVARLPGLAEDERLTGAVEGFVSLNIDTRVEVLQTGLEAIPDRVAMALRVARQEPRFRIARLRRVDELPLSFHDAWLPPEVGQELARRDLSRTSLFRELQDGLDVRLVEIYQHIDAVTADIPMARLLEVELGSPLLVTRRALGQRRAGPPTMFFESFFRSDRYYYSMRPDGGSRTST